MYPCYFDYESAKTPETEAFLADCDTLGKVNDENNWYVTEEWARKFRNHLESLKAIAEKGNPLAQGYVATILMLGYCYTSSQEQLVHNHRDAEEMSYWLERCARQGLVAAVDNLVTCGVGPEAERLRKISSQLFEEQRQGYNFTPGETWRRAYGSAIPERKG